MSIDPKDRKIFISIVAVAVMLVIAIIIYAIYQTDSNRMGRIDKIQGYSLPSPVNTTCSNI